MLTIGCDEEEILHLARRLRLTFCDASYLYYAKEKKLALVTEDSDLRDEAEPYVKALKLDD